MLQVVKPTNKYNSEPNSIAWPACLLSTSLEDNIVMIKPTKNKIGDPKNNIIPAPAMPSRVNANPITSTKARKPSISNVLEKVFI